MTAPSLVLEHDGRWRHLWLKYVQDVRLDVHCARSLVGPYDRRVSPSKPGRVVITLDRAEAPLGYYLCGVSRRGYRHNLHLPFRAGGGQFNYVRTVGERTGVALFGVERWPLETDPDLLPEHPDPRFATCRNWQHAVRLQRTQNG